MKESDKKKEIYTWVKAQVKKCEISKNIFSFNIIIKHRNNKYKKFFHSQNISIEKISWITINKIKRMINFWIGEYRINDMIEIQIKKKYGKK